MTEEELIRKAQRGNAAAFEELLGAYEQRIYRLCLKTCYNEQDAQDCLQVTMMKIFKHINAFKNDSKFSTWVYRVAKNTCLDMLRRNNKKSTLSVEWLTEDSNWDVTDNEPTPEEVYLEKERVQALHTMIDELPDDMRSVIIMRDVKCATYKEIADQMGLEIGTVKSRISRAREKLRTDILKKKELFHIPDVKKGAKEG